MINQLFKTSCLTAKWGKVQLSNIIYFQTFSLGKTNDFVLMSLKAATQIFTPSVIDKFFYTKCILFQNVLTNPNEI